MRLLTKNCSAVCLAGKFARRLKTGEVQNQIRVLMLFENSLGLFPAGQIKLPPAKGEKRDAAPREFLLKMFADKSRAAGDEDFFHGGSIAQQFPFQPDAGHGLDVLALLRAEGFFHRLQIGRVGEISPPGVVAEFQNLRGGEMFRGQRLAVVGEERVAAQRGRAVSSRWPWRV